MRSSNNMQPHATRITWTHLGTTRNTYIDSTER